GGRVSPLPDTQPEQPQAAASTATANWQAELRGSLRRRRAGLFSSTSPVWIFLALLVIVAVFGVLRPSQFLSSFDIKTIFINASVALMLSVGMTYVIITAGIDLSVGSVLVISGVLAAKVMISLGGSHAATAGWGPIIAGLAVGLVVGVAWGAFNGTLIALLGIPPLIVTLGSFGMALGLADVITGGVDVSGIPSRLGTTIGSGQIGPLPWLVVIGGTSLFGGSGTMFGTVVGVFIPVVLASGLVIVNVQSFWQQVVIGAILIIAVYFDQLRRRVRSRS